MTRSAQSLEELDGAALPVTPRCAARTLICLGVSHHTAPLAFRERLFRDQAGVAEMLVRFVADRQTGELVVVSTCNRLELYATGDVSERVLESLVVEETGVPPVQLRAARRLYRDEEVMQHLCRVAAGLDSMVLGEPQILRQVSDAYAAAVAAGAAAHGLGPLFDAAARAGRRVRAETDLGRHAPSVSAVAARVAAGWMPALPEATVLVLGSGEMAQLALDALRGRAVSRFVIVSRSAARGRLLARRVGGQTAPLAELGDALASADVAVCAAIATQPLVTSEMVAAAMASRRERPLLLLDVGLPRNVDARVIDIPNVHCYDLDRLCADGGDGAAGAAVRLPLAEEVVAAEAARGIAELRRLEIEPLIADWRARAEEIRGTLFRKRLVRMSHLSPADLAELEAFSEALVNRLLHAPTRRLRLAAERGQSAGYAMAIGHLFELEP